MALTELLAEKDLIRRDVLKKRDGIPASAKRLKDEAIRDRLFSLREFRSARSILFYASFRSEVETQGMIKEAISMGKRVSLPRVDIKGHCLKIYEVKGLDELSTGYMGIAEPRPIVERARGLEDIDLIVMPGAAFDRKGGRLGYGKGYYDRLLRGTKGQCLLLGLAYDEQIVEHIPLHPHDIRVDVIVTDREVIWTGKKSKRA